MLNGEKSASGGVDQKDLPLPETDLPAGRQELPKPEKDLPLPEKEITSSSLNNYGNPHSQKKSKINMKLIALLLFIFLLIIISGAAGYLLLGKSNSSNSNPTPTPTEQVICAQEAMLCPDGVTYVNREAPSCEFAKCPVAQEPTPADIEDNSENIDNITQEPLPTAFPSINIQ